MILHSLFSSLLRLALRHRPSRCCFFVSDFYIVANGEDANFSAWYIHVFSLNVLASYFVSCHRNLFKMSFPSQLETLRSQAERAFLKTGANLSLTS